MPMPAAARPAYAAASLGARTALLEADRAAESDAARVGLRERHALTRMTRPRDVRAAAGYSCACRRASRASACSEKASMMTALSAATRMVVEPSSTALGRMGRI